MRKITILEVMFLVVTSVLIMIYVATPVSLSASPSFGHQEIRDRPFDLVDMKKCVGASFEEETTRCGPAQQEKQSIDIVAIDYFSDSKVLNSTVWLASRLKDISLDYEQIPSYGVFIDADSNVETGWQGIDYQIEIIWNNKSWNKTLYQFSTGGHERILKQEIQTTDKLYKNGSNFVLVNIDLAIIGSPDKYKLMFYAEDRKRDDSVWKTDFSSWIDVPKPELILVTTPEVIELRPEERETIGVQLSSDTGATPEVSNLIVDGIPANMQLSPANNRQNNNSQPIEYVVTIPSKIGTGKYSIPILVNITQKSSIPNLPIQHLNLGFYLEKMNLPVTVHRSFTVQERITQTWDYWGPIVTFIAGILTGKIGAGIWETIKNLYKKRNLEIRSNEQE